MNGHYLSGITNIASYEGIAVVESANINNQLHYHKFIEIVYFDKGSGYHTFEGNKHRVSAGDLYVINPFISHEFQADEEGVLRVINIMFYADFFDLNVEANSFIENVYKTLFGKELKESKRVNVIHLRGERQQSFGEMFHAMLKEFQDKSDGYLKVLHNQLSILLISLFRDYVSETSKLGLTVFQKNRVESAIKYLDVHFTQNVNVDTIAKKIGFCSLYFNHLFKVYTGNTIPQYIKNKRLEHACRLLEQTDKSVEQICYDVGYSDVKHFYKIFREHKKMTPGEYRKKSGFYIAQ